MTGSNIESQSGRKIGRSVAAGIPSFSSTLFRPDCSATQFVPQISKEMTNHAINFSRTASWLVPRMDTRFSLSHKAAFRDITCYHNLCRALLVFRLNTRWPIWLLKHQAIRQKAQDMSTRYILSVAPREYHDFLIPNYPFGCKRVIYDPGYLESLHQPNVELVYDPIKEVTDKGVLCNSGKEHQVDVFDPSHRL